MHFCIKANNIGLKLHYTPQIAFSILGFSKFGDKNNQSGLWSWSFSKRWYTLFQETQKVKKFGIYLKYTTVGKKSLKWSFTYKQHAWGPPQNHSWKFDLWPLQTKILKIKASFAKRIGNNHKDAGRIAS